MKHFVKTKIFEIFRDSRDIRVIFDHSPIDSLFLINVFFFITTILGIVV